MTLRTKAKNILLKVSPGTYQLLRGKREEPETPHQTETKRNDSYSESTPSVQNIVDIFEGEWASHLPIEGVKSGTSELFDDARIKAWNELYPVKGKTVLELGPLEGGHSYMLEKLGAASVTSIESNNSNFLKCLITKELFNLNVKFLFGDFRKYLKECQTHYDIVLASGVIYHMTDPIQLIHDIGRVTNNTFIWTHYYSKERTDIPFTFEPADLPGGLQGHKQYYEGENL